jgi:hypothetical protein
MVDDWQERGKWPGPLREQIKAAGFRKVFIARSDTARNTWEGV